MSVHEIKGMRPFQDSIFNDCSYQVRFSVLRFYGRPIEPLVFNEEYRFKCQFEPAVRRWHLVYTTHLIEEVDCVLTKKLGIGVDARQQSRSVIGDLEEAIAEERPVMLMIDRFYQSAVPEYFDRQHFLHYVLVYGSDSARRVFRIFDDMHGRYSEVIEECVLPYDEAEQGHAACYERFGRELGERATFTAFSADENWREDAALLVQARDSFVSRLLSDRVAIEKSVAELEQFAALMETSLLENATADLLLDFYHISRRMTDLKRTQSYQFRCLSQQTRDAGAVADMIDPVARAWNLLRMRIMKAAGNLRSGKMREFAADVSVRMQEILRMEREQMAGLFHFLEFLAESRFHSTAVTEHQEVGARDVGFSALKPSGL